MTLPPDIMTRMHRGEISPTEAFALATAPRAPLRAVPAFITPSVRQSRGWRNLEAHLAAHGIGLDYAERDHYTAAWRRAQHMVTWGVKWTSAMYRRGGRNILYCENGLIGQNTGAYLDTGGYFCDSSIVADTESPSTAEVAAMQEHCQRVLGLPWWHGGDPAGRVLVALQVDRDCSVRHGAYFPGRAGRNANDALIEATAAALPGVPCVIRPHPRGGAEQFAAPVPHGWTVDGATSYPQALATCRAVVSVSSTVTTEALALGLPVAAIGRSCWHGRGVVVEAADDHADIASVLLHRPDEWETIRYLCAVMRRHLFYDGRQDIAAVAPLAAWLSKVVGTPPPLPEWEQAAAYVRGHGNETETALLAQFIQRATACKVCHRARMRRQILELASGVKKRTATQTVAYAVTPQ